MTRASSLALIALVVGISRVQAQCPTWTPDLFRQPGITGVVLSQVVFDDGNGPALYIAGVNAFDGVGITSVSRWDGVSMQPVNGTVNPYEIYSLCVFDEGNGPHLYAAGLFEQNEQEFFAICRRDGSNWTVLGGEPDANINALAVFDEDGAGPAAPQLYAAGVFNSIGGVAAASIARWNGTAWSAVGAGLTVHGISALAVFDPDGSGPSGELLYELGNVSTGFQYVNRLSAWNGTSWTTVPGDFDNVVRDIFNFDPDGAGPAPAVLFAGGAFTHVAGLPAEGSAMWDGTTWTPVAFNGQEHEFYRFTVHDEDGVGPLPPALFAAGELESDTITNVARWTGSAWVGVGRGVAGLGASITSFDDGIHGPKLVVGGAFTHAGTQAAQNVAQWNAHQWSPLLTGNGIDVNTVGALCTFDDGTGRALYVGGVFDYVGPVHVSNIARWNGSNWSAVGSGTDSGIVSMQVFDDGSGSALYVAGNFTQAGGVPVSSIARWNGVAWAAVGSGLSGNVWALTVFDAGSGPRLYAGGEFPGHLARWDGSSWSVVEGGLDGRVYALAVHDDGSGSGPALYVGGLFSVAGGVSAHGIVSWRPGHWSPLGLGVTQSVNTLASFDPGTGPILVVGGAFLSSNGGAPGHLTSWTSSGWHPIANGVAGPQVGAQPLVESLFVYDDGTGGGPALYVGGNFAAIGTVPATNLARFDGTTWTEVDHGIGSNVFCMAAFDDGLGQGAALFVGGGVEISGAVVSSGIARLGGCGSVGSPVCSGDGSGAACPCGNQSAAGSNAGCLNSLGSGARLTASGFASLGADNLVLTGTQMPDSSALYFQGTMAVGNQSGIAFGDGLRCAGGNVLRLGAHVNVQGSSQHPTGGTHLSVQGGVISPGPRVYQVWYRNAAGFCTPSTFNLSNGLRVLWVN